MTPSHRVSVFLAYDVFEQGMHFSEGGYDRVAEHLFKNLDVDVFYVGTRSE